MFKSNDKKIVIVICCLLVILLIVGSVFLVNKTNKNNNTETVKKNKEQFTDIETLTSDDLLEKLKSNPPGLQEVVALDNLKESLTKIFNEITVNIGTLTKEIEELKTRNVIDNLPKGTIIMWNEETLPSDKWKWCNGENNTPDLKYRFPLGGKSYGGEEGKPEDENDGLIKKDNVPKHRHPLNGEGENGTFPKLEHNHSGKTNTDGNHNHNYTMKKGQLKEFPYGTKSESYEMDNRYKEIRYDIPTKKAGDHTHTLIINNGLSNVDAKIENHIIGEGPIYDEDPKPFFPLYTLINFIMKVE